ncbi:recombinase family protein [Streptomyces sp. NPDC004042]|uniref:recombinase family protein n=1 Tax=Streptomyces sp. NPDC004042 TaxID=3154451 RepID=UPI0033B73876
MCRAFTPSRHIPHNSGRKRVRSPRVRTKGPGDCATSPGVRPTLSRSADMPEHNRPPHGATSAHTGSPRALGAVRLSCLTKATTSPGRQRAAIRLCAEQLNLTLIAEATDLGVSAHTTSPFERPSLSPWLRHPEKYDAVVWSHVDRAVRSLAHMSRLIEWGRSRTTTLVFGMPEEDRPLMVTPQADRLVVRRCLDLAHAAEQEARAISARLTGAHEALRAAGRYGGGLVPFGYRKTPHASGAGWSLAPDPETAALVLSIVEDVHAGRSLVAVAQRLNDQGVPVPRDRHAQLQGRPTGGRRHGRDFERFRWTSGTLSKVLRSPSLAGHRTHRGRTVRDHSGAPVLIGQPLLSAEDFDALQDVLAARSNGTRRPRSRTTSLLTGVVYCAGCGGRMYFAARKGRPYGDYVCRATARGDVCPAPGGMRSDWLESYTADRYHQATAATAPVSREDLLRDDVRVTVAKGRSGGGRERLAGPDTSRLTFVLGSSLPDRPQR